jgi:hypothetical protein
MDLMVSRAKAEESLALERAQSKLEQLKKERDVGIPEKRCQVTTALLEGQLEGKYSLVPNAKVLSYASALKSETSSGSGSRFSGASVGNRSKSSYRTAPASSVSSPGSELHKAEVAAGKAEESLKSLKLQMSMREEEHRMETAKLRALAEASARREVELKDKYTGVFAKKPIVRIV